MGLHLHYSTSKFTANSLPYFSRGLTKECDNEDGRVGYKMGKGPKDQAPLETSGRHGLFTLSIGNGLPGDPLPRSPRRCMILEPAIEEVAPTRTGSYNGHLTACHCFSSNYILVFTMYLVSSDAYASQKIDGYKWLPVRW